MLQNFLDKILEDDENSELKGQSEETEEETAFSARHFCFLTVFIFFISLIPRLYTIFVLTDPQNPGCNWYEDVYHHWQIGYLTWKIGIYEGFRLWDFKGMEYFWGIGHPLILTLISLMTGLYDIVVLRVLSAIFGSLVVVLVFLISHRFWGLKIALAAALFGALNQVGIFNDASGMIEPFGLALILLAIYFWPKKPLSAGIFLGLSTLMRAETWVFAVGIFLVMMIFDKHSQKKMALLAPFVVINLMHMKFLLDKTGNAIYPIYWNFMANAVGKWMYAPLTTPVQEQIKPVFVALVILSALGILWTFWKRPKYYPLFLLGFGNWFFIAGMFGLTSYLKAYYGHLVWATRFFPFPYFFAGLLLIIFLFKTIGRIKFLSIFVWMTVFAMILATQLVWTPVLAKYKAKTKDWELVQKMAQRIKENYEGGKIIIPGEMPSLTYSLVRFQGFKAEDFVSEMYDPFFYMSDEDPFANWASKRQGVLSWWEKKDIKLILLSGNSVTYLKLIKKEPAIFELREAEGGGKFLLYKVKPDLIKLENL